MTPAGKPRKITATWHVTILTGKESQALLEMQNQAIINLLTWAQDHNNDVVKPMPPVREIAKDSRETIVQAVGRG